MRLETTRLVIRHPELHDAPGLYEFSHDPLIIENNCFNPQTMDQVYEYLARIQEFPHRMVIALKESDEFIAEINFDRDSLRYGVNAVMFSYNMLERYRGKGYMKEAMKEAIRYCFEEKQCELVSARVFAGNEASHQLLVSLGFTHEGHLRRAVRCTGDVAHDDDVFSMLREEYFQTK